MKNNFYKMLGRMGIPAALRFFGVDGASVVLAYHRVAPFRPQDEMIRDMIVTPEEFETQLIALKKYHTIVRLEELVDNIRRGSLRRHLLAITFDDAYQDNYDYAYPILKKHKVPATVFVPTGFIETGKKFFWDELAEIFSASQREVLSFVCEGARYDAPAKNFMQKQKAFRLLCTVLKNLDDKGQTELLKNIRQSFGVVLNDSSSAGTMTWACIKEMKSNDISFGAHTHGHREVSAQTLEDFEADVLRSKQILDEKLSQATTLFAYPFGDRYPISLARKVVLRAAGFHGAFTMEQGRIKAGDDIFQLKRIGIGGYDDKNIFALKITGVIPFLNRLKNQHHGH